MTPAILSAQNTSEEIVMMKLDKNYLSEESTNASEVKARDNADLLLISRITEYYNEHFPGKTLSPEVLQNIQHMSMKRGEHTRVLSYISIAALSGEAPATKPATPAQPAEEKAKPKEETPKQQPATTPKEEKAVTKPAETKPAETKPVETKPAETKPAEPVKQNDNIAPPPSQDPNMSLHQWQMDVINELVYAKDINEVNSLLNLFKSLGKIRKYGIVTNCPDRSATFWVIGNNGEGIQAVLGPGSASRRNYSTNQTSALEDFKGFPALWFEFNN